MSYIGTKPANQITDSTLITDGTVTPADLSTGAPVWNTSGNVGIGTSSPSYRLHVAGGHQFLQSGFNQYFGSTSNFIGGDSGLGALFVGAGGGSQNYISIATAGTERMRIDSSGAVGIGTTSPSSFNAAADNLVVGTNSGNNGITIVGGTTGFSSIYLADGATGNEAFRGYIEYRHSEDAMGFGTAASERMRIDSSGNAMIGTTTSGGRLTVSTATGSYVTRFITEGNNQDYIAFVSGSNIVGSVSRVGGTNVAYNTSSDYRLKENITPMTGALAKVQQLKPCNWTWKLDGSDGQGFIAHELQEVCPDAVNGTKDEVDEDGKPKYQGVDTSFLVATLTAAIQELKAELDATKAEVALLKSQGTE